jgi:phosphatidylserine/phosphatidylglycerophosphate/cardiolipin synthase-like enzyme
MDKSAKQHGVSVRVYQGDAMTLLAFDIEKRLNTPDFVGFTIGFTNPDKKDYFQNNLLNFTGTYKYTPSDQAPFQKFRWLHVPGTLYEQFSGNLYGTYTYHIYARYWDNTVGKLKPLDSSPKVDIDIEVKPFVDGNVEVGFTRSFVTSQAFVNHFGNNVKVVPDNKDLCFDTKAIFATIGTTKYSYEQAYQWMGFTARKKIIDLLNQVLNDERLTVEMFIYDFNEPDIASLCLKLAAANKIKVIMDNSTSKKDGKVTGHGTPSSPETEFAKLFDQASKNCLVQGKFGRYQHNKVIIVKKDGIPVKVLMGSTNYSITGICVNANHVVVFNQNDIAKLYSDYFQKSWIYVSKGVQFNKEPMAGKSFGFKTPEQAAINFTFSPHKIQYASKILDDITAQIEKKGVSSVLFSVMQMSGSGGSVMPALKSVQTREGVFSFGVSDSTDHISLYKPGTSRGILVDAKQLASELPNPLQKEPHLSYHNIHHKFIVIDFNKPTARVYFGSSNLALGGEKSNGDNLCCIKDIDLATVFGIEAIRLVDHFHFRAKRDKATKTQKPLVLVKDNSWAKPYFNSKDIKYTERELFIK